MPCSLTSTPVHNVMYVDDCRKVALASIVSHRPRRRNSASTGIRPSASMRSSNGSAAESNWRIASMLSEYLPQRRELRGRGLVRSVAYDLQRSAVRLHL